MNGTCSPHSSETAPSFPPPPPFHSTQIYPDVPSTQPATDPVGRPLKHDSSEKHGTGEAVYTTDIRLPDALHLALVLSQYAYGTVVSIDTSVAAQVYGVKGFVGLEDVPGEKCVGFTPESKDCPVFLAVGNEVLYHGQPIIGVVAETHEVGGGVVFKFQKSTHICKNSLQGGPEKPGLRLL